MPRLFYLPLVEPGVYVKPKGTKNNRKLRPTGRSFFAVKQIEIYQFVSFHIMPLWSY